MPLVYSFYPEESIVSLSSKFQFSGLRMSYVDPLSGQVPSGVFLFVCATAKILSKKMGVA